MFKVRYGVLAIVLLSSLVIFLKVVTAYNETPKDIVEWDQTYNAVYSSNRYTQEDDIISVDSNPLVTLDGYNLIAENENLRLYLKSSDLSIRIEDVHTNYVWGSSFNVEDERLNKTWKSRVESALWVTYYKRTETRDEIYDETILSSASSQVDTTLHDDGFTSEIKFGISKIALTLNVRLTETGVKVDVPQDSIKETEENKIGSLKIYPFLGAAKATDEVPIPGYTLIPDGSGALIRYKPQSIREPNIYSKSIYGRDLGLYQYEQNPALLSEPNINMPLYGIVHGANQNAFYAHLTKGDTSARMVSYPAGRTTDFYWSFFELVYRHQYEQPTSRNLGSIVTVQKDMVPIDAEIEYTFLNNEKANYVGIANDYRQKNLASGKLTSLSQSEDIPIKLDFIMTEQEPGFLWNKYIDMTHTDNVMHHLDALTDQDIDNVTVGIKGWSRNGYTGTSPNYFGFDRYSKKSGYKALISYLSDRDLSYYFHVDYAKAYDGAGGYNPLSDLARTIYGSNVEVEQDEMTYRYLNPKATKRIFLEDVDQYEKYHIDGIAFDSLAYTLISSHNRGARVDKNMTVDLYHEALTAYDGLIGMREANAYMHPYMHSMYDTPMYSSQHRKFTDTVPFLPLALRGTMDLFSYYTNLFASYEDETLRLIDYGISPSFILSHKSASLLQDTPSESLLSTEYDTWESYIISQYNYVNQYLSNVQGAFVIDRYVIEPGVVRNTYDNGVIHYINYTPEYVTFNDITIAPTSVEEVLQ